MKMDYSVIDKMLEQIEIWEKVADSRSVFLRCYMMMTQNMLSAIEQREFNDPVWVEDLLNRFADYYFVALDAYEQDPYNAPTIWRETHQVTGNPQVLGLQKLLWGVNAHINYDLVLTLVDMLAPEWQELSEEERQQRYMDHCAVNEVIGKTIDAVQDQILEPNLPALDLIDKIFGRLDELLISHVISGWRETVWQAALRLLTARDAVERQMILRDVEIDALRIAELIDFQNKRA